MTLDRAFEELKALADAEVRKARIDGERRAVEGLNQTIRQIRKAETESEIATLLVNFSAAENGRSVCVAFESDSAIVTAVTGEPAPSVSFPVHDAPALLTVIESKDTVITVADSSELSAALLLLVDSGAKTHLVPVVVCGAVQLILLSSAGEMAKLETLCGAAGLRLEAKKWEDEAAAVPDYRSPLVQIGGAAAPPKWDDLPLPEQTLHLRAQRFAQVAVAQMRLERGDAVSEGQRRADLYDALRDEVDRARTEYKRQFLTGESKTMVDYLYLELLRSLANNEDRLLGTGFPGRLT